MYGTLLNVFTVTLGTGLGVLIGSRISERMRSTAFVALGLTTLLIGLQMAFQTKQILVPMLALLLGGILGEALRLEERLTRLSLSLSRGGGAVSDAFVTASLLFCIGAMAIMGAIEEGIKGTYKIYTLKAIMDGIASLAFASAMGWGIGLSALSILVVQGGMTLAASHLEPLLTPTVVTELSATGGLILVALALGVLEVKKLPVASFLPALVLAPFLTVLIERLAH